MNHENKGKIDLEKVKEMYNNMPIIWPETDKWYSYTYKQIDSYIKRHIKQENVSKISNIVNIGSAGNEYGIPGIHYHLDIAEERIKHCENFHVGSAEKLPYPDNFFDYGICVGSVINYCDPLCVISEISRVLKPKATLVLEFEQSKSLQFFGTKKYNKRAEIIQSFNSGNNDTIWIFSFDHIKSLCESYNLIIENVKYFHIISPFIYRWCKSESIAAKYVNLDKYLNKIPIIRTNSCNVLISLKRS